MVKTKTKFMIICFVLILVTSNTISDVSDASANAAENKNIPINADNDYGPNLNTTNAYVNDMEFVRAFVQSLSVTVVSELGDKTFFIAAIMAMRYSKFVVFCGALSALGLMTAISVGFGMAATFIPRIYTFYISTALLAASGLKMLYDAMKMSPMDAAKEFEEVQLDLKKRERELKRRTSLTAAGKPKKKKDKRSQFNGTSAAAVKSSGDDAEEIDSSTICIQAFTMTLLAEWGDRSQLTTIVLSAKEDATGVIIGGIVGHAICTGLAIACGSLIAKRISVRTVTFFGGILFLVFALVALINDAADGEVAV